ncbi:LysR family transcriptional regulator [Mesorhizobium sp. 1M-11]|uniref:LysR family transcriptional regulator n=1 Tax=Mesorhizobium sp. 1M-11 TaxID=1529006 RepID=UPI0009EBC2FC|nr:LysR family transcriptional regulator [Mesorhizobium sp. 1M-11]
MQLRHLKTFVAVASDLNVTRAAERIHLAQSSVSEQIQALEADLNAVLFDRSGRKLKLTEAGQRLLDHADELLARADEARAAVATAANITAGTLAIGGLETLCASYLPPLLAHFGAEHPAVRLQLKSAGSGDLRGGVKSGALDVSFVFGETPETPELKHEVVAEEELVFALPPGHRLAGQVAAGPDDLHNEPFLVTEQGCVYRQMFETAFAKKDTRPRVAVELGSIAAIQKLVAEGAGCALIPQVAARAGDGRIVTLPWTGDNSLVPISMIWHGRRGKRPAVRLFLEAARQKFKPGDALPQRAAPSR